MVALGKMSPYLYFKAYEETSNIYSHSHSSSLSIAPPFVIGRRITKLLSPKSEIFLQTGQSWARNVVHISVQGKTDFECAFFPSLKSISGHRTWETDTPELPNWQKIQCYFSTDSGVNHESFTNFKALNSQLKTISYYSVNTLILKKVTKWVQVAKWVQVSNSPYVFLVTQGMLSITEAMV